jgi:hypothetical protein
MRIVQVLKRMVQNSDALVAGAENQQRLLNDRLREVVAGIANQSRLLNDKLEALTVGFANQSRLLNDKLEALTENNGSLPSIDGLMNRSPASAAAPQQAARIVDRILQEFVRPYHESMSWGDRLLTLDKSAAFREDAAFCAALREADSSTGQNQYESPDGIVWRYNTVIWAARVCLAVPGDYVECGVFRGDMTWMITQNVDVASAGKTFFLYDTFSGFDPRYSEVVPLPDTAG